MLVHYDLGTCYMIDAFLLLKGQSDYENLAGNLT